MLIRELYLKNFGKFSEQRYIIKEGMQVFYGENEAGKSTIHAFIKGMLFGMPKGRGRASLKGAFRVYEPWEHPNYYAGVLRFTCDEKNFCLERRFDSFGKSTSLICEDDGEVLSVEQGDLDILLGGLTVAAYDNTIAISQMRAETGSDFVSEIKNYAANYCGVGDSEIQLPQALEVLKRKNKEKEAEMKAALAKRKVQKEQMEQESAYVWRDIRKITEDTSCMNQELEQKEAVLSAEAEKLRNMEAGGSGQKPEQQKARREKPDKVHRRWRIHPLTYAAMLCLVVLPLFGLNRPWNYLWALVIILAEGLVVWNRFKEGEHKPNMLPAYDTEVRKEQEEKVASIRQEVEKLSWRIEHLKDELKEKQILYSNLQENLQELEDFSEEYKDLTKQKRALELAVEQMEHCSRYIGEGFGRLLEKKASKILKELTGGKYEQLSIDEALHISILIRNTGGYCRKVEMEQISRGTAEQIYFALRMASADMLYQETLPVILDETFAYYDEERLSHALQWLFDHKRQVIVFTCQKREMEVLQKLGIPFRNPFSNT